jgi:glycosyltransferase involved in cell wall biosynthesis
MPKITIITVTYNASATIDDTILSILNQIDKNFEYLIIDGNSSDNTVEIIKKYEKDIKENLFKGVHSSQFRWISQPDKGLYDAMNKGIDLAGGEFIWFINSGDKVYSSTLSTIEKRLIEHPDADIIYGKCAMISKENKFIGTHHKTPPKVLKVSSFLNGLVVSHQSIIVRKKIVQHYDLRYKIVADYDWVIKAVKKSSENIYIDDYLSLFMVDGFSKQNRKRAWKERFFAMKAHFGLLKTIFAHFIILLKYPFSKKY